MVQRFYMENPQMLGQLQAPILEDKVVDYILELAKVEVRKLPPSELLEAVSESEKEEGASEEAASS